MTTVNACAIQNIKDKVAILQKEIFELRRSVYFTGFDVSCPNAKVTIGGEEGVTLTKTAIGTEETPVSDIYTKRIKVGDDSIRIDGDKIVFGTGTTIDGNNIGTPTKPFANIYAVKLDVDNEVDNFTVNGHLNVDGTTVLGANTDNDTFISGNLHVVGNIFGNIDGNVETTDLTLTGTLDVIGQTTLANVLVGNISVTGDVTGNVTGDVTGDIYASDGTSKVLENGTNGSDATFTGTVSTATQNSITTMTGLTSVGTAGVDTTFSGPIVASEGVSGDISGDVTGNVSGDLIGDIYASDGTSKVLENGTNGSDASFTGSLTTSSLTLDGTLLSATGAELNTYTLNLFFDNATTGVINWVPVPKSGTVTAVYAVPNAVLASDANIQFEIFQKVNGDSVASATSIGTFTLTPSADRGEVSSVTGLTGAIEQSDAVQIQCIINSKGAMDVQFTIVIQY